MTRWSNFVHFVEFLLIPLVYLERRASPRIFGVSLDMHLFGALDCSCWD